MKLLVFIAVTAALLLGWVFWRQWNQPYSFGVRNETDALIPNLTVKFPGGRTWDMGAVGMDGFAAIGDPPPPIPDQADIAWTDADGHYFSRHLANITPLPPPTRTSFAGQARIIAFVIKPDNTVIVVYHNPNFSQ